MGARQTEPQQGERVTLEVLKHQADVRGPGEDVMQG